MPADATMTTDDRVAFPLVRGAELIEQSMDIHRHCRGDLVRPAPPDDKDQTVYACSMGLMFISAGVEVQRTKFGEVWLAEDRNEKLAAALGITTAQFDDPFFHFYPIRMRDFYPQARNDYDLNIWSAIVYMNDTLHWPPRVVASKLRELALLPPHTEPMTDAEMIAAYDDRED